MTSLMSYFQARFVFSLTVGALISNVLEERDVATFFVGNIDLFDSQGMDTTPPTSFRILAAVIICCLSTPSIYNFARTTQLIVLFTSLAMTVVVAIHSSNRITRSWQSVYLGVVFWLVGTSMLYNQGLSHLNRINKAILVYVSFACIKSTFEVCISNDTDPISAGCKSCDVVINSLVSCAAAVILADALLSYYRDGEPNIWITVTCTCVAASCYTVSILLVGKLIAHNPSYLPATYACKTHPLECDALLDTNLLDRRNSIVAYSPGSLGLITLVQFVNCYNRLQLVEKKDSAPLRYTTIVCTATMAAVVVVYFTLLAILCVHANVPFTYQGNDIPMETALSVVPWLTDASVVIYGGGVALSLNGLPRIGVSVMQIAIACELARAYIEYGTIEFFQFFTMDANIVLIVVAFIGVAAATRTPWLEWIVLVGRAVALLLTLAYVCAFSIVDGMRSEQFVNIHFDDETSVLYEHKRIIMLGIRAGARAILLHFAQLPSFMILFSYYVNDSAWKWAVERHRTLSWVVWIGSCASLVGLYFVLTQVVFTGFPSVYPLSDYGTVTIGMVFVVLLPFLCAL